MRQSEPRAAPAARRPSSSTPSVGFVSLGCPKATVDSERILTRLTGSGYRIAADYEAILRWLVRGRLRLAYVPAVQVRMRLGGASNRSLRQMLIKSREDYRAMRRHGVGGAGTLALKNLSKLGQFLPARNG